MHIRLLASVGSALFLRPHGMECKCRRRCNAMPDHAFLPPSCWVFLMPTGWPPRRVQGMSWGILLPPPLPSFPGRPFKGVERGSQNKSPRLVSNKQGGKQHPQPASQASRQSQSWIGPVSTACSPASSYTPFSLHTLRICTPLHLSPPTSHVPLGSGRGALGVTPNPHPFTIPTLLVIPRFSCFYCFSFFSFLFLLPATYLSPLPCPPLLHLFLDRLTASPRLALHHPRQRPPGQPAHPSPASRHHWNAQ